MLNFIFHLGAFYFRVVRCIVHLLWRITANITISDNNVKAFLSISVAENFFVFFLFLRRGKIYPFYHVTIFSSAASAFKVLFDALFRALNTSFSV